MTDMPYGFLTIEKLYDWAKENDIEHFVIKCAKCEYDNEPCWCDIEIDEEDKSIII